MPIDQSTTKEQASDTQTQMRDAYVEKLQGHMDELRAAMDAMRARAKQAKADAKIEAMRDLEEAEGYFNKLTEQLKKLRESSGETWQEFKAGCDSSWQLFEGSVRRAAKKFNE